MKRIQCTYPTNQVRYFITYTFKLKRMTCIKYWHLVQCTCSLCSTIVTSSAACVFMAGQIILIHPKLLLKLINKIEKQKMID